MRPARAKQRSAIMAYIWQTVEQAAVTLGISTRTIARRIAKGELESRLNSGRREVFICAQDSGAEGSCRRVGLKLSRRGRSSRRCGKKGRRRGRRSGSGWRMWFWGMIDRVGEVSRMETKNPRQTSGGFSCAANLSYNVNHAKGR